MKTKYKVGDRVIITNPEKGFKHLKGKNGIIKEKIESYDWSVELSVDSDTYGFNECELTLENSKPSKPTKYIIAFDVQEFTSLSKFKKFLNENKETNGRLFRVSKSYKLKVTTKTRLVKE